MTTQKKYTKRAKIVHETTVYGTQEKRRVFYVRKDDLFDDKGRRCPTPLELGMNLSQTLSQRNVEGVEQLCWAALNFVHNGEVPENWADTWKENGPIPLAI